MVDPAVPSASQLNNGDIAWVIMGSGLVFLMCCGLGFFYSGMARANHALSLMFLMLVSVAVVSFQWYFWGYSLTFSESGGPFIGDFAHIVGRGIGMDVRIGTNIPTNVFFLYQMMFACITPALAFGASAERMRLFPAIVFVFIWTTLVYDVVTYWVWNPNGWLSKLGVMDYAGGTPVHISSGLAAVAYAMVLGKRKDYGETCVPHNVGFVFLGTALLWFGWFGFNGGSALAANARGVQAIISTHISGCVGGLLWSLLDYRRSRKWSMIGFCTGAVAGLAMVTPAAGYVSTSSALVFGVAGGVVCNFAVAVKHRYHFDDALDVFAVHYVGGLLGLFLTGIFAQQSIIALSAAPGDTVPLGGWLDGHWMQVPIQLAAIAAVSAWSFGVTYLILMVMNRIPGLYLRLNDEDEMLGTDMAQMGEIAYGYLPTSDPYNAQQSSQENMVVVNAMPQIMERPRDNEQADLGLKGIDAIFRGDGEQPAQVAHRRSSIPMGTFQAKRQSSDSAIKHVENARDGLGKEDVWVWLRDTSGTSPDDKIDLPDSPIDTKPISAEHDFASALIPPSQLKQHMESNEPFYNIMFRQKRLSIVSNISGIGLLAELLSLHSATGHAKFPTSDALDNTQLPKSTQGSITEAVHQVLTRGWSAVSMHSQVLDNAYARISTQEVQRQSLLAFIRCEGKRMPLSHDIYFEQLYGQKDAGDMPHPVKAILCALALRSQCKHVPDLDISGDIRFELAEAYFAHTKTFVEDCLDSDPTVDMALCLALAANYKCGNGTIPKAYVALALRSIDFLLYDESGSRRVGPEYAEGLLGDYQREMLKRAQVMIMNMENYIWEWYGLSSPDEFYLRHLYTDDRLAPLPNEQGLSLRIMGTMDCFVNRIFEIIVPYRDLIHAHRDLPALPLSAVLEMEKKLDSWYSNLPASYRFQGHNGPSATVPVIIFSATDSNDTHASHDWRLSNAELATLQFGLCEVDGFTLSQLLTYYTYAVRLHQQFMRKHDGEQSDTISRSEAICLRASEVINIVTERVLELESCSVDYDISFDAADVYMHTSLNFSDPEIVTFASDHLAAWLDRAKRVYVNASSKEGNFIMVVLPGDVVEHLTPQKTIRLGPGLKQEGEEVQAIKSGVVGHSEVGNRWWIVNNQRKYIPGTGESVLGVVVGRTAEFYKVDIGAPHPASLSFLAFEGATKRHRPNLAIGALVYARVMLAVPDLEPEIECVNPTSGKADGFGPLTGGFVITCSLGMSRRLLDPDTPILSLLGTHFPFETAVGMNGRVWIHAAEPKHTVLLANAILNSEYLSADESKSKHTFKPTAVPRRKHHPARHDVLHSNVARMPTPPLSPRSIATTTSCDSLTADENEKPSKNKKLVASSRASHPTLILSTDLQPATPPYSSIHSTAILTPVSTPSHDPVVSESPSSSTVIKPGVSRTFDGKRKRSADAASLESNLPDKIPRPNSFTHIRPPTENPHAPQVKLVDGKLVLDTDSLVISQKTQAPDEPEVIDETHIPANRSNKKRTFGGRRWTKQEIDVFYKSVEKWGEDYPRLAEELSDFSTKQIRRRYETEMLSNPLRMSLALSEWRHLLSIFTMYLTKAVLAIAGAALSVSAAPAHTHKPHGSKIKNVFVLMLENHSFENMFGHFNQFNPEIQGLTGRESNYYNATHNIKTFIRGNFSDPADPPHALPAVTTQLYFDPSAPNNLSTTVTSNGYVAAYAENYGTWDLNAVSEVMETFDLYHIPTSVKLAQEFAVMDEWFAAVPGPTNPNREYLHTATSAGMPDNSRGRFQAKQRTIYDNLEAANVTWRVYRDSHTSNIYEFDYFNNTAHAAGVRNLTQFFGDTKVGDFASYTFFDTLRSHPVDPVSDGEYLVKNLYEVIRASSVWEQSLFLITFDEHGGYASFMAPPSKGVPNPDGINSLNPQIPFNFDRLGIRVPTLLVGPYVKKGSVIHKDSHGRIFDHSSVPATLKELFGLPNYLTKRDAWSAHFLEFASLPQARKDCPMTLPDPVDLPTITSIYNEQIINTANLFLYTPVTLENRQAWFQSLRERGYPALVAVESKGDNEVVLGWCCLGPFRSFAAYQ
ncbi:hypothetical protein BZG36_05354, partial [Bifiguratus adelaidae]